MREFEHGLPYFRIRLLTVSQFLRATGRSRFQAALADLNEGVSGLAVNRRSRSELKLRRIAPGQTSLLTDIHAFNPGVQTHSGGVHSSAQSTNSAAGIGLAMK